MLPLFAAGAGVVALVLYQIFRFLQTKSPQGKTLTISKIYVYPIKSLRATELDTALATKHGFAHDRCFMLLQKISDGYKNMAVSNYPKMTQFLTSMDFDGTGKGTITVSHRPTGSHEDVQTVKIPLMPDVEMLEPFDVTMYGSPTKAFKMPEKYSAWFTEYFGFEVMLVYLGNNKREVLFKDIASEKKTSWLPTIVRSNYVASGGITFADCAPYLVVSSTSLTNVSARLPADQKMDITKFRPNIIIDGAAEAWEEDYWYKLKIGGAEIITAHNCGRCKSINIDYDTGKPGTNESGEVLKRLQKDRRVDTGLRWSPVFGRYGFWGPKSAPQMLRIGDEVRVAEVRKERTTFNWPGIG